MRSPPTRGKFSLETGDLAASFLPSLTRSARLSPSVFHRPKPIPAPGPRHLSPLCHCTTGLSLPSADTSPSQRSLPGSPTPIRSPAGPLRHNPGYFPSTPAPAWSPLMCKAARRCGLRLALPGPPPCSQHRQHCAERSRCSADWRPQEGVRCRAPSRSGEVSLLLHSDLRLRPTHVREVSQLHSKATDFNTNLNRKHHHRTSRIMSDRISGHRDPDQLTRTLTITDPEQDKPKGIPAPDT